ncbi:ECF transporter S component [Ornithinicoccus halotolerans]|uniref:ECF transporter S component n=1 Tax=Ornithinicoccus halotolerans TaxID=1748220 RepID=UPI0012954E8C|nr:ECF transporter S component [Ornithinicoccus halotolerans]
MTAPARPGAGPAAPRARVAVPVPRRSVLLLVLAALLGLAAFGWPLLLTPSSSLAGTTQAPFLFAVLLPLVLAVVLAEISDGGLDVKALALLGVLSAVAAGLRVLGTGTAGIQPMFFLLVLAGRVFGPGFGLVLGTTAMFGSALLTGGAGPWLPFQMMAAGFVGMGAGLLPRRVSGRAELVLLAGYGALSGYLYGLLLNLSFWPFTTGYGTGLSFDPAAGLLENVRTFGLYTLATSMGYDTGRALTTAVLVLLAGPGLLVVLRRAARRARFDR